MYDRGNMLYCQVVPGYKEVYFFSLTMKPKYRDRVPMNWRVFFQMSDNLYSFLLMFILRER